MKPVGDVVQPTPYVQQQSLLDAAAPKGRRYYWKSEYLAAFEKGMISHFVEQASVIPSPHSAILLFPLDGAINAVSDDHSPVGNRDAGMVFNIASGWENPSDDAVNLAWTRETWNALRPFSTGGSYVNFQSEDEGVDRLQAAYGNHIERLSRVKAVWDPENCFRANRNIRPAPEGRG